MGYFDLKKQIATKQPSTTSSKSGYFALKQKVAPTIASLEEIKRKKAQEERIKMLNENTARLAEESKQAGSAWGLTKETAKGVGRTLLDFGKEALRFPVTAPLKVVQSLSEAATGQPQVYTPQTGVEKFVYGEQPRQSYQQDREAITKFAQEKGLGKGTATALGVAGAGAEIIADVGLPGAGKVVSKIATKSPILKSIISKIGSKAPKIEQIIESGTKTEKEIVDIFEEKGLKGVEEVIAEPKPLKPGELAPIVKEIEETTGKKFKPSEALQVKADLEKGISKESIINDIVEPPKRTTSPVEPPKVKKPATTTKESPLIQEARKYKSAEEFVKSQGEPVYHGGNITKLSEISDDFDGLTSQEFRGENADPISRLGINFSDNDNIAKSFSRNGKIIEAIPFPKKTLNITEGGLLNKIIDKAVDRGANYLESAKKISNVAKKNEYLIDNNIDKQAVLDFKNDLLENGYDSISFQSKIDGGKTFIALNKNIFKTKSQLTSLWNKAQGEVKSQPLQEGLEKVAKEAPKVEPKIETGKSITAKKLNETMPDDYRINEDYDKITLKEELERAGKEISENKDEALRKAFSKEERVDRRIAKLEEFSQIAKRDKDFGAVNSLFTQANKVGTETAQGLNMFKALYATNPEYKFMNDVVNSRLKKITVGVKDITKATKESAEIIAKKSKEVKEATKKAFKIKDAQELLDKIMCK